MKVEKMKKLATELVEKLEKLKQAELAAEFSWCWVSFQNDQNSTGVIEKANQALVALKEAREKNAKSVSKKLVDELEKALA
ncbi:hypothetical protein GCM10009119_39890 [Algoriphagus jejuensis]|uniref:Uncharacterized protein n=1 Tax=Algoriphagus jejuensis TaxID=419934 RepID=A0ABP3YKF0_9BACT